MVAFPGKPVFTFPAIFVIDFKSLTFPCIFVFIFPSGRLLSPAPSCFHVLRHDYPPSPPRTNVTQSTQCHAITPPPTPTRYQANAIYNKIVQEKMRGKPPYFLLDCVTQNFFVSLIYFVYEIRKRRSPSLGACNYPIFLSWRFHRPIYFSLEFRSPQEPQ